MSSLIYFLINPEILLLKKVQTILLDQVISEKINISYDCKILTLFQSHEWMSHSDQEASPGHYRWIHVIDSVGSRHSISKITYAYNPSISQLGDFEQII